MVSFARGFCLALDNIAKATPAGGLKPVRFVNGEPIFHFRVEAIRCGNYLTADGQPFEVTPAALKHWTDTFKQFAARKIPVPVRARISRSAASTTAATSSPWPATARACGPPWN